MQYEDKAVSTINGFAALAVLLLLTLLVVPAFYLVARSIAGIVLLGIACVVLVVCWTGLLLINPRQGAVFIFFGRYAGVASDEGFYWVNPLYWTRKVSTQTNNFETTKLKVNDASGSPIEIAAVVVWRVRELAQAVLAVDSYHDFLKIQSESALREIASSLPYASRNPAEATLVTAGDRVLRRLLEEIQSRVTQAGIEIEEARITHLAYAPEIAGAMLQVQQARAMLDARKDIVLGATSMVDDVIAHFRATYGEAAMPPAVQADLARALMVVLCSAREAQPVVSVG